MKLLITRPEHDIVTSYTSAWSKELITLAESNDFKVKDLKGKDSNVRNFEKYVTSQKPELILLNGHGNSATVTGHNNQPLITSGKNEGLLCGSVVHALSCESSLELGRKAVAKGARAYIGYNFPFMFITDKNNECRPGCDPLANVFKKPAIEAPRGLILGKTIGDAYRKAKDMYKETILSYSTSDSPLEAESVRFALFSNMVSLDLACEDETIVV